MQRQDIEKDVRKFIADQFFYGRADELTSEGSLLGSVIDSTGLLELVTFIQEHFGITVEDEDIVPENLGTVKQVVDYVDGKLKAKTANG
ncbi:MAG: acyl carrier protein [Candidatus Acidiferrales bacterium]